MSSLAVVSDHFEQIGTTNPTPKGYSDRPTVAFGGEIGKKYTFEKVASIAGHYSEIHFQAWCPNELKHKATAKTLTTEWVCEYLSKIINFLDADFYPSKEVDCPAWLSHMILANAEEFSARMDLVFVPVGDI